MKRKGLAGCLLKGDDGLRTRYLGEQWMKIIRRGVEISRELGLECWVGDDDRAPSGSAGGLVTRTDDGALAMAITWYPDAAACDSAIIDNAVAYTRSGDDGAVTLTIEKPADLTGCGVFATRRYERGDVRFNGENYADLLDETTVKEFIDTTHEQYKKQFRYDFGEHMPVIFTDMPNVHRENPAEAADGTISFPWCAGFAAYFEELNGYSPWEHLHHLLNGSDEGFSFRHDYWTAINQRFANTFTKAITEWCSENDLMAAGRFIDESLADMVRSGGSVMAQYDLIDIPVSTFDPSDTAGVFRLKQASGAADQLGKKRSGAVIFGGNGYGSSLADLRRSADAALACGISQVFPVHHPYTITGDRKRMHTTAFSYHQSWWDHFRLLADYLGRCSWIMRQGRSAANVLVLNPTGTAYGLLDLSKPDGGEEIGKLESSLHALVSELTTRHIQFELGDEIILARHGSVEGDKLIVGRGEYSTVVLPPSRTWSTSTLDLLESFTGAVIVMGDAPDRVDGIPGGRIKALIESGEVITVANDPAATAEAIGNAVPPAVTVTGPDGADDPAILLHQRIDAAAHIVFLVNTDAEQAHALTLTVDALGGVVELDAAGGRAFRYISSLRDGRTIIETSIPPSSSRLFVVDQTQTSVTATPAEWDEEPLSIEGPYVFQRLTDNTLPLDKCTLIVDGKTLLKNESPSKAPALLREKTGIDDQYGIQPWVLEERNMRTRTNKTVLSTSFTVASELPNKLFLGMESADKFTVTVNDTAVLPSAGNWYLDRQILVFNLKDVVKEGENTIVAETDYLWDTEIDRMFLYGNFGVTKSDGGWTISGEPDELAMGSWTEQGYPFYAGSMVYKVEFDLSLTGAERYEIDTSGVRGATVYITVNETEIGGIPFPPYRGDITAALTNGLNKMEIEVVGSIANELGELDGALIPYGIIEPPKLVKITEKYNIDETGY